MSGAIFHVVRDRATIVGITADGKDHHVVRYGQGITGWPAGGAIIHQPPACEAEELWLREVLYSHLSPRSVVTLGPGGTVIFYATPPA